MVYVNGLKYACEACIKGHRSSSCSHNTRPLFEIKKKGRPVTQCEHCRRLRKTKQVHVKCNCGGSTEGVRKELRGKAKRKIPISADFPEGLSGQSLTPSPAPQDKSKASSSSCVCDSSGHCSCATPIIKKSDRLRIREPSSDAYSAPATPPPLSSLSSCCGGKNKTLYESQQPVRSDEDINTYATPVINGFVDTPPAVHSASHNVDEIHNADEIYYGPGTTWPSGFGVGMCSCGALCACPGCYEHSNPSTVFSSESCPYACITCSDCHGFGFATSTSTPNPASRPSKSTALLPPALTSALPSFASISAPFPNVPSSSPVDCCGGSCQCSALSLSCECPDECCGCCFGCSCSDTGSVGAVATQEEDLQGHLGFAVSGERASCCTPKLPERDPMRKRCRVGNTHDALSGLPSFHATKELPGLFPAPSSETGP